MEDKVRVWYVVRLVEGAPDTFGNREVQRQDVAKFFSRADAEAHEATVPDPTEVEEREEPASQQHPAHFPPKRAPRFPDE